MSCGWYVDCSQCKGNRYFPKLKKPGSFSKKKKRSWKIAWIYTDEKGLLAPNRGNKASKHRNILCEFCHSLSLY